MSRSAKLLIGMAVVMLFSSAAWTQRSRQGANQAQRRGDATPEQMQKRMLLMVKQRLGATNDEWKALAPKIEGVMALQQELAVTTDRAGMRPPMRGDERGAREGFGGPPGGGRMGRPDGGVPAGGPGAPGGPGGPGDQGIPNGPPPGDSELAAAQQELRAAVESKATSAEDLKAKLAAYRELRDKARAQLLAAQKELAAVVTARQESTLVIMGMLE